jgi:hypothetical protein
MGPLATILAPVLIRHGISLLGGLIGGKSGAVVERAGKAVLDELGARTPEEAAARIETDPVAVAQLRALEEDRIGEWLALARVDAELAALLARQENERGFFSWGWRPAMSWLVVAIAAVQFILGPLVDALWSTAALIGPYEHVLGFAAVWLTIYGGGHTAKAIFGGRLAGTAG